MKSVTVARKKPRRLPCKRRWESVAAVVLASDEVVERRMHDGRERSTILKREKSGSGGERKEERASI